MRNLVITVPHLDRLWLEERLPNPYILPAVCESLFVDPTVDDDNLATDILSDYEAIYDDARTHGVLDECHTEGVPDEGYWQLLNFISAVRPYVVEHYSELCQIGGLVNSISKVRPIGGNALWIQYR